MSKALRSTFRDSCRAQDEHRQAIRDARRQELIDCGVFDINDPYPRILKFWLRDEEGLWHFCEHDYWDQWHALCTRGVKGPQTVMFHPDYFPWYESCITCVRLRIMQKLTE